jgi:hypothetical protein
MYGKVANILQQHSYESSVAKFAIKFGFQEYDVESVINHFSCNDDQDGILLTYEFNNIFWDSYSLL